MAPKSTPLAHITVLAIAVLASGCTGARDRFPSLAVRPSERAFGSAQPVDAAPTPTMTAPVPASASVVERVGALKSQAADAQRAFIAARPAAARLAGAARGSSPGGEAWSIAQVALAKLDSARSQGMIAMADLDRMLVVAAQAAVDGSDADLKVVEAAHGEVSGALADDDAVIAELRAQIAG